jgi:hypothetical protein
MSRVNTAEIRPAPRWRHAVAGVIDATLVCGLGWGLRRTGRIRADGRADRLLWLIASAGELVRTRVRSPGQRLLGLRSVDERTGRRIELWRSLVLLGADAGGHLIARRLRPAAQTPDQEGKRERFIAELGEIMQRHPENNPAREAERRALFERYPPPTAGNLSRSMGAPLAVSLINSRLRRRLAPTTEILVRRGRGAHSP